MVPPLPYVRDDDVARLLEGQAERRCDSVQHGPRLIVQEHAARREHCRDVRHRQHQLSIVEVGEDVRGHDEIERLSIETFGHDVQGFRLERAGGRRAHAHGAVQVSVNRTARHGWRACAGNGAAQPREVVTVFGRQRHGLAVANFAHQVQRRRCVVRATQV